MKIWTITCCLLICLASCKNVEIEEEVIIEESEKVIPGSFAHTVYFWLVDPEDQAKNKAFEESLLKFLHSSEDISTYHVGRPADTDRPIIDRSYTYSLLTTFASQAAHDRYQEDAAHKLFIKESESLWTRVQIYDSVSIQQ